MSFTAKFNLLTQPIYITAITLTSSVEYHFVRNIASIKGKESWSSDEILR